MPSERAERGLPCPKCSPGETPACLLENPGLMSELCQAERKSQELLTLFRHLTGNEPWALQRLWARRLASGSSFAMLAPTGVGKTTFGLVTACWLKPSVIIVPTKALVQEVLAKLEGFGVKALGYTGKKREKDAIARGEFEVLVITVAFLSRNYELLRGKPFKLVFVDDVDSLLSSSRNVDRVLGLLGFSPEEISKALKGKAPTRRPEGLLLVSSATAAPKTKRVELFWRLLGFQLAGGAGLAMRNVLDTASFSQNPLEDAVKMALKLGEGGLVFVSRDNGRAGAEEALEALLRAGVKAAGYWEAEAIERFKAGEVDVLVGISSVQNPLARGLDMPERVRYALFVDAPKLVLSLDPETPRGAASALLALRKILGKEVDPIISALRPFRFAKPEELPPKARKAFEEARLLLERVLSDEQLRKSLEEDPELSLRLEPRPSVVLGDASGYLQASGRTSRLWAGGLTKGLSIVFYEDRKAFKSLVRRLRARGSDVEFVPLEEVELDKVIREIDKDREAVRRGVGERRELLRTALVVVESPTKAKTIASFFGRPQPRKVGPLLAYDALLPGWLVTVAASQGHVVDLPPKGGLWGVLLEDPPRPLFATIKRCPDGSQTTADTCPGGEAPTFDKGEIIEALRRLAWEADLLILASDPDTEGERIAWDVANLLSSHRRGLARAEFHEITQRAFMEALENLREVDRGLVCAQLVRRITDRWVGFWLSKEVQRAFKAPGLSAGRVQTPVLGWVIERASEAKRKKGLLVVKLGEAELRWETDTPQEARALAEELRGAQVSVESLGVRPLSPPPPFHTGTLLAEPSLGVGASKAMELLQELFEKGLITYHRTSSTRVSEAGFRVAKALLGDQFLPRRWGEGGAHECIRPAKPITPEDLEERVLEGEMELPKEALWIYRLIFRRFLASQSPEAKAEFARVRLGPLSWEVPLRLVEPGFAKWWRFRIFPISEGAVPELEARAIPKEQPYTQGSLVDEMRRRGLGRPSTYAKIVSTLLLRRYVVERRGKLYPTPLGVKVHRFLARRFGHFVSEEFTRALEEKMDSVEEGNLSWGQVLKELLDETGISP